MNAAGGPLQPETTHEQDGEHDVRHGGRQPHHLTRRLHSLQYKIIIYIFLTTLDTVLGAHSKARVAKN